MTCMPKGRLRSLSICPSLISISCLQGESFGPKLYIELIAAEEIRCVFDDI